MLFLIALFFFASTHSAYAYIDPGGGSYFLQYLIAGFLGGLYLLRSKLYLFKDFLLNLTKNFKAKKRRLKDGQE